MNIPRIPRLAGLAKVGKTFVKANRPEILFGAAVTGTITSIALAARGGWNARGIVEEARLDKAVADNVVIDDVTFTTKEIASLTWMCYLPAASAGVVSLGSITGLHLVHVKEKKALAQATLAAVEEVKAEAAAFVKQNTVGVMDDKEKDKVLKARDADKDGRVEVESLGEDGDPYVEELVLIRDARTGRDVWSSKLRIEEAVNNVNKILNDQGDCDLNAFYNNAGFDQVPDGDMIGWSGPLIELSWSSTVRNDGRPVAVFDFRPSPEKGFGRAY